MRLACSSWSYHAAFREGRIDQRAFIRTCAEDLEMDGVELVDLHFPTTDAAYLRELKRLCTELQLTITAVAVTNDFGPDATRLAEIQKVQQWCDVAAYLGAPVVRVFAGWVPIRQQAPEPGRILGLIRRVLGERPPDLRRLWSDSMWALRRCADYAAERGVVVAVQNNRRDGIVGSTEKLVRCTDDVGTPWLRAGLDPADLAEPRRIDVALERTVQVRTAFHAVQDDGSDPAVHWPEVLQLLSLARYRGFLTLDYDGLEAPESALPRATVYLRGALHLLARQRLLQAAGAPADHTNGSSNGLEATAELVASPS